MIWHDGPVEPAAGEDEDATANRGIDSDPAMVTFQRAALDALAAARALLDATEAVIRRPDALEQVVTTVNGVARLAADAASRLVADATAATSGTGGASSASDDEPGPSGSGGFRSIPLD